MSHDLETTKRVRMPMECLKGRQERVYCPNILQRVRQFIPGLQSSGRKRMLSKVGD